MSLAKMQEIRFDKYRLIERISHGGMAEVFRAKTEGAAGFEREVAIKLLLPTVATDDDFINMLIDEAKIAGQLSHANIAQIFDLGSAEGRYFIVQEYVRGRDLRSIAREARKRNIPLTIPQACHILLKVLEGLDYAHNKRDSSGRPLNVVHRDVSPQNILISMDGEVKLIDFGIAKAEGRTTRTMAGLVKGKFAYMSPEQIRGLPVDRRSDVFACGIVFHELLTGKPLFLRKSEFETLKRARSGKIDPPSHQNPAVPGELDDIALRALARHLDDRFQSADDFRVALWNFVRASSSFCNQTQLAEMMDAVFGEPSDDDAETHSEGAKPRADTPLEEPEDTTASLDDDATQITVDQVPEFRRNAPAPATFGEDDAGTIPEIPPVRGAMNARMHGFAERPDEDPTDPDPTTTDPGPSPFALPASSRPSDQFPSVHQRSDTENPSTTRRLPKQGGAERSPSVPPLYTSPPSQAEPRSVPVSPKPTYEEDDERLTAPVRSQSAPAFAEIPTNPDRGAALDNIPTNPGGHKVRPSSAFPKRASRHSVRALDQRRREDVDISDERARERGRINRLLTAAVISLALAGAAATTYALWP